ncbi:MAG: SH3 domain-containing protein, partial [Verrucomicrobiota bacterium]
TNLPEIPTPANAAPAAVPAATNTPEVAPAAPTAEPAPAPVKKKAAPKKHVVKKISEPTVTLVPGPATIIAEHLNMRGQAGMKGEAIGRLKVGETVTVVSQINLDKHAADEPAQWAKILLPSETKVWVNTHYIDAATKTVKVKKLNLRAGPGENFSVLGVIEKGASVNELSTKGAWAQIEAPADSFAFVAAMYLKQEAVASTTPATTEAPAVVPVPAPTPVNVAENQTAAGQSPAGAPGTATGETPGATTAGVDSTGTAGQLPATVDTNPPPARVVSHEGYVRSSVSPVAPTPYELFDWDTGNVINYLNSPTPDLDLSHYKECRVIVTGEEGMSARWAATPVLTIQKIFVTATGYPDVTKRVASPRASQKNISGTQPLNRR